MAAALLLVLLVPWPRVMPALPGRHTGRLRAQFAAEFLVDLFTFSRIQTESSGNKS